MIEYELLPDQGIVVITPTGPLESRDFLKLATEVDAIIASEGRLSGVVIYAREFPGWKNIGAFLSHIRFVAARHRKIERVALVTDSSFLKAVPHIAGHLIHPKIKQFNFDEKSQALSWLKASH